MKKLLLRMYGVAVILFLFLFLYGLLNLRLSIQRLEPLKDYMQVNNYSTTTVSDASAPIGEKTVILFRVKAIDKDYNSLFFVSKHQNAKVLLNGDVIYSLTGGEGVLCPKSPGIVFNEVPLPEGSSGSQIQIELESVYKGIRSDPVFMVGSKYEIIKSIFFSNFLILLLCTIIIVIGIVQLCVAFMNRKRQDFGVQPAVCHALFTITIGLWKILDCSFIALWADRFPAITQISFIIFMTLPVMLTKTVKDQMGSERSEHWVVADIVNLVEIFLLLFCQCTGIMDFWESIWVVQLCLIIDFICIGLAIQKSVSDGGWNKNNKTGAVVAVFAFVWIVLDMLIYYLTSGVTAFPFHMVVFLIFLLILVTNRLKISRKGMETGMQANQYKKLAYHDALTGFMNRAAYTDFMSGSEFEPDKSVILAFDLNNLKKCNDELGHEKGDQYIKESAKIINDCFGENGRCYRLGGDEFGVILTGETLENCAARVQNMLARVDKFNRFSTDIHMGIACGYAKFDPQEDEDIHATIRRADKMMYEEKFRMKQMGRG